MIVQNSPFSSLISAQGSLTVAVLSSLTWYRGEEESLGEAVGKGPLRGGVGLALGVLLALGVSRVEWSRKPHAPRGSPPPSFLPSLQPLTFTLLLIDSNGDCTHNRAPRLSLNHDVP